jgi:hypothetical protein
MSTKEIQDIIHQLGVFMFRGGSINEGMVVARYNIREAKIEYYFIDTGRISDYRQAKSAHDVQVYSRIGRIIDVNSIIRAQLFN